MAEEQRVVDTPVGPIPYTLTVKTVKNMNLRIRPDGTVAVSVSRRVPKSAADQFVRSRAPWITAHRASERLERVPLSPPDKADALPVLTASLERMYPAVESLGVRKPELRVRYMTSRWGSCHWGKGVIVMNTALVLVEEGLMDYVTLHELVHFLHPNHGKGFYSRMDSLLPDWRERRRRLKGYTLVKGT